MSQAATIPVVGLPSASSPTPKGKEGKKGRKKREKGAKVEFLEGKSYPFDGRAKIAGSIKCTVVGGRRQQIRRWPHFHFENATLAPLFSSFVLSLFLFVPRCCRFVSDKNFKGAKPGNLPVE